MYLLEQIIIIQNAHKILSGYNCYGTTRINSTIGRKVEHIKVAGGTADAHSKCSTCGWVIEDAAKHSFTDWKVTKAPTCTAKGEETRTCSCGYKETKEVDALGHNLVATDASDL